MTLRYAVASTAPLVLLVVAVTCLVLAIIRWRVLLVVTVAAVALLWWMYCNPVQVRTRWWGAAPTAEEVRGMKAPVYAVGGGWSSYLQHQAPGEVVFTHKMRGEYAPNVWGAGTTIEEVQATLRTRGQTLSGHPSILTATLGGWIFSGSHGSGGTLWKPSIDHVTVWDQVARRTIKGRPKRFFNDSKTEAEQRRYLILDVRITPVPNVWCQRTAFAVTTTADAQRFLTDPSYLRLIFVNRHAATCLLWTPDVHRSSTPLIPAYLLSFPGALPLPSPAYWNTRQRLSDANAFGPDPPLLVNAVALAVTNFELFVFTELTDTLLLQLCDAHKILFKTLQGRLDIRYGPGKLFLDYAIVGSSSAVFATLKPLLGDVRMVLHKGKAQVEDISLKKS